MKNQIFVRGLLPGTKIKTLDVNPDDTVYDLMSQIEDLIGLPPIMQRLRLQHNHKYMLHDTPGTLADHELVRKPYSANIPPALAVMSSFLEAGDGWGRLHRKTLVGLGYAVPDEDVYGPSILPRPDDDNDDDDRYPEQKLTFITVMDHIRTDGGDRRLVLFVVPGNTTVAIVKEEIKRTRRYPVEMQLFKIIDADSPDEERLMDNLDATLADYGVKDHTTIINMYMDMEFALQADREERGKFNKSKEIAAGSSESDDHHQVDDMKKTQKIAVSLPDSKTVTLDVDPDGTVYDLMSQIEDVTGIPPVMQRLNHDAKDFSHDTPGTLKDNKLVALPDTYSYSANIPTTVSMTKFADMGWSKLQRKTLKSLGFTVFDEHPGHDGTILRRLPFDYRGHEILYLVVWDHIRMDGGNPEVIVLAVAVLTVANVMEQIERIRRYPVGMQLLKIRDLDNDPNTERPMDKLGAKLGSYGVKRGSKIHLYMNMEYAIQADKEERGKGNKAKEIAECTCTQHKLRYWMENC